MELINRNIFLESFDKLRRNKVMSASRLAANSGLSQSYVYLLLSQTKLLSQAEHDREHKNSRRSRKDLKNLNSDLKKIPNEIQKSTAEKLCHGLNLTDKQTATILHKAGDTASHRQAKFSVSVYVERLMKKQGLSTNKLADKSGLNDHRLKDFLNNGSHFSKVSLIKLARGLGLKADALVRHYMPQSKPATLSIPSSIMKSKPKKRTSRTKQASKPRHKKTEKTSKSRRPRKTAKSRKTAPKSKKKVPTAHKAIDTFNVAKSNTTDASKKTLRPEVLDLARYINYNLSDTQIAVLRLLVEQMRH